MNPFIGALFERMLSSLPKPTTTTTTTFIVERQNLLKSFQTAPFTANRILSPTRTKQQIRSSKKKPQSMNWCGYSLQRARTQTLPNRRSVLAFIIRSLGLDHSPLELGCGMQPTGACIMHVVEICTLHIYHLIICLQVTISGCVPLNDNDPLRYSTQPRA